jgi:hypothetical protein
MLKIIALSAVLLVLAGCYVPVYRDAWISGPDRYEDPADGYTYYPYTYYYPYYPYFFFPYSFSFNYSYDRYHFDYPRHYRWGPYRGHGFHR